MSKPGLSMVERVGGFLFIFEYTTASIIRHMYIKFLNTSPSLGLFCPVQGTPPTFIQKLAHKQQKFCVVNKAEFWELWRVLYNLWWWLIMVKELCLACQLSKPTWIAVTWFAMIPTFSSKRLNRPINSSKQLIFSARNQCFVEHFSFTLGNTCFACAITWDSCKCSNSKVGSWNKKVNT